jgi:hypothetical protein
LDRCDTFVLEYADPWFSQEADKEDLYNKLSKREISPPIGGKPLDNFTNTLQHMLYGKGKNIVLERSPLKYDPDYNRVKEELKKSDIDSATRLYKTESQKIADSIVKRDEELVVKIIEPLLMTDGVLFSFRGLLHSAHMRCLLKKRSIHATCLRLPTDYVLELDERIIAAMTLGEIIEDVEVLRRFFVMKATNVNEGKIESMTEDELRRELLKHVDR